MSLRESVIRLAKTGLRAAGVEVKRYTPLAMACDLLTKSMGQVPVFVQIGANNGTDFDDFYEVVTRNKLRGIVVEPVPRYFNSLKSAYERHPNVLPVNVALHPTAQSMPIYTVRPDRAKHVWQHGVASFSRDHVLGHPDVSEDAIEVQYVPCIDFNGLLDRHLEGVSVDILAIDTEGFDGEILAMIDWSRIRPRALRFEHKHLSSNEFADIRTMLSRFGYRLFITKEDCTAVERGLTSRVRFMREMLKPSA